MKVLLEKIIIGLIPLAITINLIGKIAFIGPAIVFGGLYALIILYIGLFGKCFYRREHFSFANSYLLLFTALLAYAGLTVLWSRASEYGFSKYFFLFFRMAPLVIVLPLIKKHLRFFLIANFICTLIGIALLQVTIGSPMRAVRQLSIKVSRLGNAEGNPLYLARFCAFGIINAVFFYLSEKSNRRIKQVFYLCIISVLIGFLSVYLFLSGSRGPMIGVVVALVLIYLYNFIKAINLKSIIRFGSIVGICSGVVYAGVSSLANTTNKGIATFIIRRFSTDDEGASSTSYDARVEHYQRVFQNLDWNNFFTGNGIGDYGYLALGRDGRMYPHNITLEMLIELGVFGLFFLLILYVLCTIDGMKLSKMQPINIPTWYVATCCIFFLLNAHATDDMAGNYLVFLYTFIFIFKE